MNLISASIVVYNTDKEILSASIDSYLNAELSGDLYLIDNSQNLIYREISNYNDRIIYIENSSNPGYGKSHNIALERVLDTSRYHIVINPDVSFASDVLLKLVEFYKRNNDVGIISPQALNVDGSFQSNGRLIPTFSDLILKRLGIFEKYFPNKHRDYMMEGFHGKTYSSPVILGSFMMFSIVALKNIGFFDERFFLYPEDIDLSRRFSEKYTNFIAGDTQFYHHHKRESYTSIYLTLVHIKEMIKYFNKWGWFDDDLRKLLNAKIRSQK